MRASWRRRSGGILVWGWWWMAAYAPLVWWLQPNRTRWAWEFTPVLGAQASDIATGALALAPVLLTVMMGMRLRD